MQLDEAYHSIGLTII